MLYLCTSLLFTVNVNTTLSCFLNPHYYHCILNTPLFFSLLFVLSFSFISLARYSILKTQLQHGSHDGR
ncbi:hypothetical protein L419_02544 [Klebsiella pneumoniae UCICRE 8]|nr:hypothetical protein L419_02544 [Klebsiella pneumoniae UCICRE 8]